MTSNRGKNYLPVEALWEFKVQEITPDGQEILEKPLTQAENFQRIVNGIDFHATNPDDFSSLDLSKTQQNTKVHEKTWLLMRDQIRNSLTEVCAFIDLMSVIQETKCINITTTTPSDQDMDYSFRNPKHKSIICLAGKKMALAVAAETLLKGAERFRSRFIELSPTSRRGGDLDTSLSYHERLIELRKSWRIKLMQNTVLGDVSLRCLGSRAKEGGNFEVTESNSPELDKDMVKIKFSSAMESLINRDRCTGRLLIRIKKVDEKSCVSWNNFSKSSLDNVPTTHSVDSVPDLQMSTFNKLSLAQNLLMCREILSTLSYEVSLIGPSKIGNSVVAFSSRGEVVITLFPGVQLIVSLEKLDGKLFECHEQEETHLGLSTQLKRLLFRQHINAWTDIASIPNPPSGPVQVPQRLRAAGGLMLHGETVLGNTYSGVESLPILVASVAGVGGLAASSWMVSQNHSQNSNDTAVPRFAAPVGQDRHSYFLDWGTSQHQQQQSSMGDVTPSSMTLSGLEHAMRSSHASPAAISCVLGSGNSLLGQLIGIARHRFVRANLHRCLTEYARDSASPGMCMEVLWHSASSPFESSVNVTFHSLGYSTFRSRLTLRVRGGCCGHECAGGWSEIVAYGLTSTGITIPAVDVADTAASLKRLLKAQEVRNQMSTLQGLASRFLGWTQLGCTTDAAVNALQPHIVADQGSPLPRPHRRSSTAIIMASPSGRRLVCVRSSLGGGGGGGVGLLVAKIRADDLSRLASDSATLEAALLVGDPNGSPTVTDKASDSNAIDFRKVDLARLQTGRHDVAKIEAVLTCLSSV